MGQQLTSVLHDVDAEFAEIVAGLGEPTTAKATPFTDPLIDEEWTDQEEGPKEANPELEAPAEETEPVREPEPAQR
ncbi:hypothetical protein ACFOVU_28665 [Nocardiopsis sediminis]|uniref:Uncharacterized protein n=1 Tax=Nocardiopsis sediminis TaxID=1778267 RepID=A0ABV8FXP1_9ACTN